VLALPCLCANLRRATRAVTQLYDRALRPVGLRVTQFTLLQVIERSRGITASRLGDFLAIDATTLSRTLRPLRRRGWIAVEPGRDRRLQRLTLTPPGRRQLVRAWARWERAQANLGRTLGRREWRTVMAALERVVTAAREPGRSISSPVPRRS